MSTKRNYCSTPIEACLAGTQHTSEPALGAFFRLKPYLCTRYFLSPEENKLKLPGNYYVPTPRRHTVMINRTADEIIFYLITFFESCMASARPSEACLRSFFVRDMTSSSTNSFSSKASFLSLKRSSRICDQKPPHRGRAHTHYTLVRAYKMVHTHTKRMYLLTVVCA